MATATKKPKITPTLAPSSREDLERKRAGVVAVGPSGAAFRIRAVPLLQHALAGGLPQRLREMAMQGTRGINRLLAGSDEDVREAGDSVLGYMDELVLATVIEPKLEKADLHAEGLDDQPLLHPKDYRWLVEIANGDEDRDAQGRLLWAEPPLDISKLYADAHNCPPGCDACEEAWVSMRAPAA